jgi:hypothetical protein
MTSDLSLGSMYLVIVMASCRVRQDVRALNPEFFGRIARELRRPHRQLFRVPFLITGTNVIFASRITILLKDN